jgi:predicted ATP-binding protein involved in virulence
VADDRFYVKTLTLENFRCFEKAELGPFDPHFNLLIGENGAGKSSVLVALAELFSPMGTTPDRRIPKRPELSDIRKVSSMEDMIGRKLPFQALLRSKFLPATAPFATMLRKETETDLTISEDFDASLGATRTSESFFLRSHNERLGAGTALPLIAFYKTERRFLAGRRDSSTTENLSHPRYAALNGWTNAGLQSQALTEWLRDETLAKYQGDARYYLASGAGNDSESGYFIDLVVRAVAAGVEGAKHIDYSGAASEIVLTYNDGRKQKLSEMSDGQRAIVCLFADLARRMCILNGSSLQERALTDTPGLVLIDEIDLHLHPKWQRQIVPALKKVFPKIQFFATTHSPQVIGECRPEEIVLLTPQGQKKYVPGSYGMDSNWILECVMEAEGRNPEIAKRIKSLFDLIDNDRLDEAKAEIRRLREELPAVAPDIVSAEAYIWNLEHSDEAAE